jgi:hypothetical protein
MRRRKRIRVFSYVLMLTLLTGTVYGQTAVAVVAVKEQSQSTQQKELKAILKAAYHPQRISWWDSGNGIICKYTVDNKSYITRYDKQGNYIETLRPKAWNDSSALRPYFQKSQYRLQKVISYWEVSDANKKGYYLEMSDSTKQVSSVWADELGKFSTIPTVRKSNQ